jgi:ATP-dependent DNA helicase DinG
MGKFITDLDNALGEDGVFHQHVDNFVPRDVQQNMAEAVNDAINFHGKLVVESGTGTGKTFAYLAPAILSGKKTIVSTGTKHLQEQIYYRDLPVVLKALNSDIKVEMLKGRSNYLCRYRHKLNSQQSDLVGKQNQLSFDIVDSWSRTTATGDISEVSELQESSPVWKQVTSTTDNCLGGKCPDYSRCFVNQARKRAMDSDVVVVNHHLFFSDLTLKTDGFGELLPQYEVVIFDEAHSVAEIASRFFGFSVSSYQIKDLFFDILTAEKEEKSGVDIRKPISLVERALESFQKIIAKMGNDNELLEALRSKAFDDGLDNIVTSLANIEQSLLLASQAGENLEKCFSRFTLLFGNITEWRENQNRNHVSWLEKGSNFFRIHQTPLNIGDHFNQYLDLKNMSWIFTSATLAVGDDFSSFCGKMGLIDVEAKRWESPYNYAKNTLLYLPEGLPDPREAEFVDSLVRVVLDVTKASKGRCFCLFTSHSMMRRVFELVKVVSEWPLFLQGQAAKQHLIKQFLETDNAILFGTASFWEGVDVKGEALSCVIIDKLPFEFPSDPVLKSQLSKCEEQGGVPFMDIQVPNAVIGLKQGSGRLIRSETDRGVLVICDPRIISKSYGKLFLKSLPPMPITRDYHDVVDFYA